MRTPTRRRANRTLVSARSKKAEEAMRVWGEALFILFIIILLIFFLLFVPCAWEKKRKQTHPFCFLFCCSIPNNKQNRIHCDIQSLNTLVGKLRRCIKLHCTKARLSRRSNTTDANQAFISKTRGIEKSFIGVFVSFDSQGCVPKCALSPSVSGWDGAAPKTSNTGWTSRTLTTTVSVFVLSAASRSL